MFIILLFSSSWKELDVDAEDRQDESYTILTSEPDWKNEHDQCKKILIILIFVLAKFDKYINLTTEMS